MKKKHLFIFIIGTTILTSCRSYSHSYRLAEIGESNLGISDKIVVDIEVDLEKTVKARSNKHSSVKDAKQEAYFRAIVDNNVHVLVDPIYSIETTSKMLIFGGKSVAEVIGFAGYYKNPRTQSSVDQLKFDADLLNLKKLEGVKLGGKDVYTVDSKCCGDGKGTSSGGTTLLYKEEKSAVQIYHEIKNGNVNVITEEGTSTPADMTDEEGPKKSILAKIKGIFKK